MLESCKFTPFFYGCCNISGFSFLFGRKQPQVFVRTSPYKSGPSIAVFSFVNSFYTTFTIFVCTLIPLVLRVASSAQIIPTKVARIARFMVDLFWWEFSCYDEPCKPMSHVHRSVNSNNSIAVWSKASGYFSFLSSWSTIHFPSNCARFFIIRQQTTDVVGANILIYGRMCHARVRSTVAKRMQRFSYGYVV